ncbi:unnamed protein product [Notodromas monacha]|uniref:Putative hydroxypyruvate isomerase n=1 Tax=Notodromas monacha TaxID=399045 RepID=A0A7R9BL72_9CRUS|nr:unnamed protein product [Notodromas monacha]CAG0917533.1 unnamed protein product [Notodromas monacha]
MAPLKLKLAANISMMFTEVGTLLERYGAAKCAGFSAVECAFPYDFSAEDVGRALETAGVEQVLINSPPGNLDVGELGLAALPGREKEFLQSLDLSVKYAKILKCSRIHIMAGKSTNESSTCDETYMKNLRLAVPVLENAGITGLIEPINPWTIPKYHLSSYDHAVKILRGIDSSALKLQLDVFHLQLISGNITRTITDLLPMIGHIQIAQAPHRGEPDTPGEIDYSYMFKLLEDLGYDGWIGCEYIPSHASTKDGLAWMRSYSLM